MNILNTVEDDLNLNSLLKRTTLNAELDTVKGEMVALRSEINDLSSQLVSLHEVNTEMEKKIIEQETQFSNEIKSLLENKIVEKVIQTCLKEVLPTRERIFQIENTLQTICSELETLTKPTSDWKLELIKIWQQSPRLVFYSVWLLTLLLLYQNFLVPHK
jgi:chromosome segregation ATPase